MKTSAFPPRGLTWFWFLNDAGEPQHIDRQIKAFADAGAGAVCLHPRCGHSIPYVSDEWFEFIRRTARGCARRGLQVWLYDEDPYPSGNAGGRLVMEHPEYEARKIAMFEADRKLKKGDLFYFPTGKLLWAGLVATEGRADSSIDLTPGVGVLRRKWKVLRKWDSRWYYPATPLYTCDRAWMYAPEYALRVPAISPGMKLVAFVAVPSGKDSQWGTLADTLNPAVTRLFLDMTHERYHQVLGDMFGREITAMFTDEPKYFGQKPWTPGMFEGFRCSVGYDLPPRLHHLFTPAMTPEMMRTRIDYREWCGRRFCDAWMKPVSAWCHAHRLKFIGHVSPEDDPVEQANTISNLFPLQKHFDVCGLDLIIPAVGDQRHPLINLGVIMATSVAQQTGKPGVMSESLGCSGNQFTAAEGMRILNWQTAMGVTTPVIHGAFSSVAGHRYIDAPPDFGPVSKRWPDMVRMSRHLPAVQEITVGAAQVAPVAIIWPIRSFQADMTAWQGEPGGLRGALAEMVLQCLERQVGVHFIDEADVQTAGVSKGMVRIGKAAYSHLIVPECLVIHSLTVKALDRFRGRGVTIIRAGAGPKYVQNSRGLHLFPKGHLPETGGDRFITALPRLIPISGRHSRDVRCTVWIKRGVKWLLLINIGARKCVIRVDGHPLTLPPGAIVHVRCG